MIAYSLFAAAIWVVGLAVVFGCLHRATLRRLWREPVLRGPVLIIESDDWGPGPVADAGALQRLAQILGRHRDARGGPAVMTLGMLLAVPDTEKIRQACGQIYFAASISESRFGHILAAIRRGADSGVFSAQLHGMEHYWPDAVMKAARDQKGVRGWLMQDGIPRNEDLPAGLQSRWIDASELPSGELPRKEVAAAARRETEAFRQIFGMEPIVAVPPTFVWNDMVEEAWSMGGVRVVVTPGTRFSGRDRAGRLCGGGAPLYNGETGPAGMVYVVRDDYFEPALGHRAERALAAIEVKARLGRPTLLETHRFNFTGPSEQKADALRETELLIRSAVERFPHIRFMSTAELAGAMIQSDAQLGERSLAPRVKVWLLRAAQIPRLRKLAWLSGAIFPAWLAYLVAAAISKGSGQASTT